MTQGGLISPAIKAAVPANFRTSHWTGIAKRASIVYYAPERVSGAELSGLTYESLADPKWKGRLVIRKSSNIYNKSLVASLVKNNGKKATAEWAKGVVANMARTPEGNDRAQIMAVAAGELILQSLILIIWHLCYLVKKVQSNKRLLKKLKHSFQTKMIEELT